MENEKVLKIIKNKCVGNTNLQVITFFDAYEDYCFYFESFCGPEDTQVVREHKLLTKEEFDLLKRWVNNYE